MTRDKQNLIEAKIHYDNLRREREQLAKEKEELLKKQNDVANSGLSKFFLIRIFQVIFRPIVQIVKSFFGFVPNEREMRLHSLNSKEELLDYRIKQVQKQIKEINKEQTKNRTFDTISNDDMLEYRENIVARENEINQMRVENEKSPSLILKEFSQIKGWDEPINKHKILDFVLEKKDFIDKFIEAYRSGNVAFEYDGKKYTSFKDDDYRTIYSDDVDIKDIEAALSFALGQNMVFDFRTMRYVAETFECHPDGTLAMSGKSNCSNEQLMIMKEYGERLSKVIEQLAKERHPDLFKYHSPESFQMKKDKFEAKKNVSTDKWSANYYQQHKDAMSLMVANKCFIESKIVTEFNAIKGTKKPLPPEKIMDYLFAKKEFLNQPKTIPDDGLSFKLSKDNAFRFQNDNHGKYKVFDVNVGLKDIESALTSVVQMPVHYDFQSRTFKSTLFEVNEKGQFIHSETLPPKEYMELSKFFKTYGEKTANLFVETAKRDAPSLLYQTPASRESSTFKEVIMQETETKRESYEKSKRSMLKQGKKIHTAPTTVQEVAPEVPKTNYHGETLVTRDYVDLDKRIDNTPSDFDKAETLEHTTPSHEER